MASNDQMVKSAFATSVDRPPLFLMFEMDEFIILMVFMVFSLILRQLLYGLIVGMVVVKLYIKIKEKHGDNFLFHYIWKHGIVQVKETPPTFVKKFLE